MTTKARHPQEVFGICAGLRVQSNTLKPKSEEEWEGDITVETLPSCQLSEKLQKAIAVGLATRQIEKWLHVDEWNVFQVGNLWVLTPISWGRK